MHSILPHLRKPEATLPLAYSGGPPDADDDARRSTIFHQAATASWVAALIAIFLCLLVSAITWSNSATGTQAVFGLLILAIVGFGALAGFVALIGTRKVGRAGLLGPAIAGVVLNVGVLGLVVAESSRMLTKRVPNVRVAPPPAALLTRADVDASILAAPGWTGAAEYGGVTFTLSIVDPKTPFGAGLRSSFSKPFVMVQLVMSDEGSTVPLLAELDASVVHLANGRTVTPIPAVKVIESTKPSAGHALVGSQLGKVAVGPGHGQESKGMLVLPPDVDPAKIDHVMLRVKGRPFRIDGSVQTPEQKAATLARIQATRSAQ